MHRRAYTYASFIHISADVFTCEVSSDFTWIRYQNMKRCIEVIIHITLITPTQAQASQHRKRHHPCGRRRVKCVPHFTTNASAHLYQNQAMLESLSRFCVTRLLEGSHKPRPLAHPGTGWLPQSQPLGWTSRLQPVVWLLQTQTTGPP